MNQVLEDLLRARRVVCTDGVTRELTSAIGRREVEFIQRLLRDEKTLDICIEVGCAYGIGSLAICEVLSEKSPAPQHVVADPFQFQHYRGDGLCNIEKAGFSFTRLIEKGSETALPMILDEFEGRADVVFIDGWHTFDHTLLDVFYAIRLLKIGGVVIVDDAGQPAVGKALSYLSAYPHLELIGVTEGTGGTLARRVLRYLGRAIPFCIGKWLLPMVVADMLYSRTRFGSMAAFRKIREDQRDWNWHATF